MSEREIKTLEMEDSTYEGEILHGKPDGKGKMTHNDGCVYEGEWKNGSPNGVGTHTIIDKYSDDPPSVFVGEWKNGMMVRGKYRDSSGWEYEGEYKDGEFHGYGEKRWEEKYYYKGQWKDGEFHGKGIRKSYSGIWDGEWVEGYAKGKGTYLSDKGWKFTGYADEKGKSVCKGRIEFSNGDVYEGEARIGFGLESMEMHGKGVYTYKDGRVWKGEFKYGKSEADRKAEWEAEQAEKRRLKEEKEEAERKDAEWQAKDPVGYQLAKKKALRERLEEQCRPLFGNETDIRKRYSILQDAYFQAHNSGFNDHMAWEAASGREDGAVSFWDTACRLKYEVETLCEIYKEELGE